MTQLQARLPGDLSAVVLRRPVAAWQLIRFVRAGDDGYYTEEGWSSFPFRGRSLYHLRIEVATHAGVRVPDFIMCVRAGRYGRPTPLVVDLPRDGHYVTIEIVVIIGGTQGETVRASLSLCPQLPTDLLSAGSTCWKY